jgi:hypothetical protein
MKEQKRVLLLEQAELLLNFFGISKARIEVLLEQHLDGQFL